MKHSLRMSLGHATTRGLKLSPSMTVALLALFVALGGTAVAGSGSGLSTGAQIKNHEAGAKGVGCTMAGRRYVGTFGKRGHAGKVCFTLTPTGNAVREAGWIFTDTKSCASGISGLTTRSNSPLSANGSFDIRTTTQQGTARFWGTVQAPTASGHLRASEGMCGPGSFAWTAHRSS